MSNKLKEWAAMADPTKMYDQRHGGPFDRGSADSYYGRPFNPHYFEGATYSSKMVELTEDSPECEAYGAGYQWNEQSGNKKY